MELITFHTMRTTYQIGITEAGFLLHLYYGPRIKTDVSRLLAYYERGMSGVPYDCRKNNTFSCDVLPMELPCWGNGDYRSPAVCIRSNEDICALDLRFAAHRVTQKKAPIPGLPAACGEESAENHEIILKDTLLDIEVVLRYSVFYKEDVITKNIVVINHGIEPVYLEKGLTATLDFMDGEYDFIHFYGRHMMERMPERLPVGHEKHVIESRRGASSHQHNPFVILAQQDTNDNFGICYGMSLMYSGNFQIEIEKDQFEQTRIQIGMSEERLDYELKKEERLYLPEVILSCSDQGLHALSQQFHFFIRQHVCRGKYKNCRRPVLINNWEATYFDFTGQKIVEIARQAKELGIEMLVLDDGWFGDRNDDCTGLGDWNVNETKLGGTLGELVQTINGIGLKFGLWIEPEMVNENSELYRAHPDFALKIPGRNPVLGRNQLVLDFSRSDVVDYIFEKISSVLDTANIEYIKMDMNRSISDVYSAVRSRQNAGTILHQYVLGVYGFLDRLIRRYPDMLIEGCSSGGGRFDAGMLYYTPQIWCSDNTDAIERLIIQDGTAYGYPFSSMSAHVSAVPNHQTGRSVSLHTRGVVAMSGNLGYELDLTVLKESEKKEIQKQIQQYKEQWELVHQGHYYRGNCAKHTKGYVSWNFVSADRKKALLNVVQTAAHANRPVYYAKCYGLKEDAVYYCQETQVRICGSALAHMGLPIPIENEEYCSWQYHFVEAEV